MPSTRPTPLQVPTDTTQTLDARARGYLHGNCSICHRPQGPGLGTADYRFAAGGLAALGVCNSTPQASTLGISDDPPLLVIGIQDKNFSLELIQKSKEFVVNVCSQNQLHAVDRSRDLSGRNVEDKFVALGLDTLPAKHVQAPLVAGCHANVECRVVNEVAVDSLFLFIGEALASYVDDQVPPVGRLAGKTFRLDGPI